MRQFVLFWTIGILVLACMEPGKTWASDEWLQRSDSQFDDTPAHVFLTSKSAEPLELFNRTQAVFRHFGIPSEADSQPRVSYLSGRQTLRGASAILKYLDPQKHFKDFSWYEGELLNVSQDFESKSVLDYSIRLAKDAPEEPEDPSDFHVRLLRASQTNSARRPLAGLKIAIDPGHMGTDHWDVMTGKFVRDKEGRKLSEGVLALQTALLLEEQLVKLGARVMLTRRELTPVTHYTYQGLPLEHYAKTEMRELWLDSWFQSLLQSAPEGETLFQSFSRSPNFRKLFAESQRSYYFILRADLDARVEAIDRFAPDITIVIHYDTSSPEDDPTGLDPREINGTKAYVAGAYSYTEFASRDDRVHFARHLMDSFAWDASLGLSQSLVTHLSTRLQIPHDRGGGPNSVPVTDGVFARNLAIPRKLARAAVSYLECLFYNDPNEFYALLDARHSLMIGGKNYPYSDRLITVVEALREGILGFVRGYSMNSRHDYSFGKNSVKIAR